MIKKPKKEDVIFWSITIPIMALILFGMFSCEQNITERGTEFCETKGMDYDSPANGLQAGWDCVDDNGEIHLFQHEWDKKE